MKSLQEKIPDSDRMLLAQAADYCERRELKEVCPRVLRQILRDEGIDFATAVLYCVVMNSGSFCLFPEEALVDSEMAGTILAIVPGAFYVEHPETGADGRRLREAAESLNYETQLIETESVGTLSGNADIILGWLRCNSDKRIVLASFSKGGADLKLALQRDPKSFRNVIGWINLGGTTEGSPIVTWILSRRIPRLIARALFWWRGREMQFLYDLNRIGEGVLDFPLSLPSHLRAIHVVGFPLRSHLSIPRARTWHRRLTSEGPNDGATILLDACQLPGIVYPVWGADHYAVDRVEWNTFTHRVLQYFESEYESASRASCLPLAQLGA
jgi:hypothetical protein